MKKETTLILNEQESYALEFLLGNIPIPDVKRLFEANHYEHNVDDAEKVLINMFTTLRGY